MTKQMERRIRERWEELRPALVIRARQEAFHPMKCVEEWQALHQSRVVTLLRRGVRLRKIRTHGWDDPLISEVVFCDILYTAVNNLRKRTRRPPHGLAKFARKRVPSTKGDTDVTNRTGIGTQ